MSVLTQTQVVFTVDDVAMKLRVPQKTIVRLIERGELKAIKIDDEPQAHYRILWHNLADHFGEENTRAIFGQEMLEDEDIDDEELNRIIDEARAWAKAQAPERPLTGRVLTKEEIAERFKHKRERAYQQKDDV